MIEIKEYQKEFIEFLLAEDALLFGSFKIKSGRLSPYFLNFGKLNSGAAIHTLGQTYAHHIKQRTRQLPKIIFGPAYKGIPLAVTTSMAVTTNFKHTCYYCFDRKEAKTVGEGGNYVGHLPQPGDSVVLVEDVVTAGTTLKKIVPILQNEFQVELDGVFIAVDRCEVGEGTTTAVQEMERTLGINIHSIVTIHQIFSYLSSSDAGKHKLGEEQQKAIKSYLDQYGAKCP